MLYEQVLRLQPRHFDATHLTGLIALQQDHAQLALQLIGRAIQINSGSPSVHINYGNALSRVDRCEEAVSRPERPVGRDDVGLPRDGCISWMRILRRVDGSVLWLSEDNPTAAANLRQEATRRGIAAERLIFARRVPSPAEHLARHRAADLFLNTLPYNAHTTAADSLWASLLRAVEMPELIADTARQYEDMAFAFACDAERLTALKHKLAVNRLRAPLFDTRSFTAHLEAAYTRMYERWQAGSAPAHIEPHA